MKAFLDSSTLLKKSLLEEGSDEFCRLLENISEIIVAPVAWLETNSAVERRFKEKSMTLQQKKWILKELKKDFHYYSVVLWNENLEETATAMMQKYGVRMLDSVQLASGSLSLADIFVTSDKKLFGSAKKELKKAQLIL